MRPENPQELSDEAWGDYLFFRKNPKGIHFERWVHIHGCRRWFNAVRNTHSDRIYATYKPAEPLPRGHRRRHPLNRHASNKPTGRRRPPHPREDSSLLV